MQEKPDYMPPAPGTLPHRRQVTRRMVRSWLEQYERDPEWLAIQLKKEPLETSKWLQNKGGFHPIHEITLALLMERDEMNLPQNSEHLKILQDLDLSNLKKLLTPNLIPWMADQLNVKPLRIEKGLEGYPSIKPDMRLAMALIFQKNKINTRKKYD